jgi:hypothetical protein
LSFLLCPLSAIRSHIDRKRVDEQCSACGLSLGINRLRTLQEELCLTLVANNLDLSQKAI